jgi:hypothetical protein
MLDENSDIHPIFEGAPNTTEFKKLRKRIIRNTREAIEQYGMVERGRAGLFAYPEAKTAIRCWLRFMS